MTYIRVETESARYVIALIAHRRFNRPVTAQPFDALVLEGASKNIPENPSALYKNFNFNVARQAFAENKPIYNVDISPKRRMSNHFRNYLSNFAGIPASLVPFRNASTAELGPIREKIRKLKDKAGRWLGSPFGNMRSAIMADRLETIVAPSLQKEVGKKPTIMVCVGAAHSDLKDFLGSRQLRESFLSRFHNLENFFEGEQLAKVARYAFTKTVRRVRKGKKRKPVEKFGISRNLIHAPLPKYKRK